MDQRERVDDWEEAFRVALDGLQSRLWTALPGIIQSVKVSELTGEVQAAVVPKTTLADGTSVPFPIPKLIDCPIVFPSGGGWVMTFPLAAGDEVLLIFATRCINAWWAQSGAQPEEEFRLHDLSDGFAIPGPFSKPKVPANISTTQVELRKLDNSVKLASTATGFKVTGSFEVTADFTLDGSINVTGNIHATGDIVAHFGLPSSVSVRTHLHGGVQVGTGSSSPPTAGT